MSRQQEFICGLSQKVTMAVLPKLNTEELRFELNRRNQNLDKENSSKEMSISNLRDVMLEEYRQLEERSVVEEGSPNETSVPGHEPEPEHGHKPETTQEKVPTVYAETGQTKLLGPTRHKRRHTRERPYSNVKSVTTSQ
ncbi:uncharacterized protein LOC144865640 isoform X2 [Branchiostoma floridae x Branchiostoma japonicum]